MPENTTYLLRLDHYLIFPSNNVYFNFDSCCSQQQLIKSSRTFYKAGTTTEYGQTYKGWSGNLENWLPKHLAQGSFGTGEVEVQGKRYGLVVVNDTQAKKTTIIIGPD